MQATHKCSRTNVYAPLYGCLAALLSNPRRALKPDLGSIRNCRLALEPGKGPETRFWDSTGKRLRGLHPPSLGAFQSVGWLLALCFSPGLRLFLF
ncbi:hypothetical protein D3OALGA1CA_57 [Olavius algarvensis associated proteobacterium Delta 3]|nr:hypothetical protein D3OALGA1CA_57 [Olavius algarvensis associated proteobacterium Delta 3]